MPTTDRLRRARCRARCRVGSVATVAALALGVAACGPPSPETGAADASTSQTRLTSVAPAGTDPSEFVPPEPPKPPDICTEAALTTEQVAALTGIPLDPTPPVAPGGRKEMCAYGGLWSSPRQLFTLLDDADADPNSQVPTTSGATTPPSGAATALVNAVSVGARPLQARTADTLRSIPELLGPDSACERRTRSVEVPDLAAVTEKLTPTSSSEATATTPAKKDSRYGGIPEQAPGIATLDPTATRANLDAGKRVEMDFVECESTPTQATTQSEIFFVGYGKVWEINAIVPGRAASNPSLEKETEGLRSLAALLASR